MWTKKLGLKSDDSLYCSSLTFSSRQSQKIALAFWSLYSTHWMQEKMRILCINLNVCYGFLVILFRYKITAFELGFWKRCLSVKYEFNFSSCKAGLASTWKAGSGWTWCRTLYLYVQLTWPLTVGKSSHLPQLKQKFRLGFCFMEHFCCTPIGF